MATKGSSPKTARVKANKTPSQTTQTFDRHWKGSLKDYITALSWSPDGHSLAISSTSGEVVLWSADKVTYLRSETVEQGIDCLDFSADGRYLAAAGQQGQVFIWHMQSLDQPATVLPNLHCWITHLAWHPDRPWLTFGAGHRFQVWDIDLAQCLTEQDFVDSSVLGLAWHPLGDWLAVSGHHGVKVWQSENWDQEPSLTEVPGASITTAWSPNGQYLASGNLDRTLTVVDWETPPPWLMQGFPGKVRQVAWAPDLAHQPPQVAAACLDGITVWHLPKHNADPNNPNNRWKSRVLKKHQQTVVAIAFHPTTALLASAAQDGKICLWQQAKSLQQTLKGVSQGFSILAWHPKGQYLAAGGNQGEILIWAPSNRGKGFQ